ncbi:MAG: ATP-binding cassette domain-containing protein [Dysgonamonadaceae bacterium]|jgi:ABC-type lipoprotein export system ATPase subunit|nr:ATP-binding cassette domain-containing protein [Dysgonamonadaceae bacterium]
MNQIQVNDVLPHFISGTDASVSEIWCKKATFHKGEYYLLAASSGAGKSSFLSFLFGERNDYHGDILFDETKIDALSSSAWRDIRKNRISFVFQGLKLFSELTAFENIILKNRLTHYKTEDEIICLLNGLGLAGKKDEKTARLSFGQQQRVAILRALCQPFDFLFLDEPFSHLDDANIEILSELILNELQMRQAGMILCSLGQKYSFNYQRCLKL